jgi:hypothetical protein
LVPQLQDQTIRIFPYGKADMPEVERGVWSSSYLSFSQSIDLIK